MEIVQERLEREYDLDLITTSPSVVYQVHTTDGEVVACENPAKMPPPVKIVSIDEPYLKVSIHVPSDQVGGVLKLCEDRRGTQVGIQYASKDRVIVTYELPMAEVLFDFSATARAIWCGWTC
jgi:GTP-binding protein LepA